MPSGFWRDRVFGRSTVSFSCGREAPSRVVRRHVDPPVGRRIDSRPIFRPISGEFDPLAGRSAGAEGCGPLPSGGVVFDGGARRWAVVGWSAKPACHGALRRGGFSRLARVCLRPSASSSRGRPTMSSPHQWVTDSTFAPFSDRRPASLTRWWVRAPGPPAALLLRPGLLSSEAGLCVAARWFVPRNRPAKGFCEGVDIRCRQGVGPGRRGISSGVGQSPRRPASGSQDRDSTHFPPLPCWVRPVSRPSDLRSVSEMTPQRAPRGCAVHRGR